jgi:hypothetical protein
MKDRGLDAVTAESEALFQKVIDRYADIRIENNYPQGAAELAKWELHVPRNLCIGRKAPDIVSKDIRGKAMRLAGWGTVRNSRTSSNATHWRLRPRQQAATDPAPAAQRQCVCSGNPEPGGTA